jgi:hypothetical protein
VKYRVASRHCLIQRCGVAQIANRGLGFQPLQIFQIARRANQQPQVGPALRENAGYVGS